jgi:PAS domain-containing protein
LVTSTADFQRWFDAAPDAYLLLAPDLTIAGVNRTYALSVGVDPDAILGRPLFDVFPENPAELEASGKGILRASLERVLTSHAPDTMPVIKYDVMDDHGRFRPRFWSVSNTPILDEVGRVRWILNRPEEVTSRVGLGLPVTSAEFEEYAKRTQAALEDSEHRLRQSHQRPHPPAPRLQPPAGARPPGH